jgi:hypothetical protein
MVAHPVNSLLFFYYLTGSPAIRRGMSMMDFPWLSCVGLTTDERALFMMTADNDWLHDKGQCFPANEIEATQVSFVPRLEL